MNHESCEEGMGVKNDLLTGDKLYQKYKKKNYIGKQKTKGKKKEGEEDSQRK